MELLRERLASGGNLLSNISIVNKGLDSDMLMLDAGAASAQTIHRDFFKHGDVDID